MPARKPHLHSTFSTSSSTSNSGQALIDVLIAAAIFLILSHAIFTIIIAIYDTIIFSKNTLSAKYIASEKIEFALNLPYDDLGTTTGIPNGIIPEYETISRNGQNYEVHTTIAYRDDPFDDVVPTDLLPTDYKQIRVSVNLAGELNIKHEPVTIVTNISPKGIETSNGGGTLSILVINAQTLPVSQAQIHITNTDIIPNVDITLQTNVDGRIILPGAMPCSTCYHIQVTKDNYTQDKTYTTAEVLNPNQKAITVAEGALTESVFVIDQVSPITITSVQNTSGYPAYPNATFRLTGTKAIGTNIDGDTVYKFDHVFTTNSSGQYTVTNGEWDNYVLNIPADQNQDLAGTNPNIPIPVQPGQSLDIAYIITTNTDNSLLLTIKNASGSAVASASAILRLDPSFIATDSSGLEDSPNFGQVFFDNLLITDYQLNVSHPNYATHSATISVKGNTTNNITLNE